jgi:hypothetical protein
MELEGDILRAAAWADGSPQPDWQIVVDTSLTFTGWPLLYATGAAAEFDDLVVRDLTKFTVNAFIQPYFTVNAHIVPNYRLLQESGYSLLTEAGEYIQIEHSAGGLGSFAADSVVRKTITGSGTVDATIRRAASGSFTADAVIEAAAGGESGLLGDHTLGTHELGGD